MHGLVLFNTRALHTTFAVAAVMRIVFMVSLLLFSIMHLAMHCLEMAAWQEAGRVSEEKVACIPCNCMDGDLFWVLNKTVGRC